jgi:hypothetical protein
MIEEYRNMTKKELLEVIDNFSLRTMKIESYQVYKDRVLLGGTDQEDGQYFTIEWDSYDFLTWIDTEKINHIKDELIEHLKEK